MFFFFCYLKKLWQILIIPIIIIPIIILIIFIVRASLITEDKRVFVVVVVAEERVAAAEVPGRLQNDAWKQRKKQKGMKKTLGASRAYEREQQEVFFPFIGRAVSVLGSEQQDADGYLS